MATLVTLLLVPVIYASFVVDLRAVPWEDDKQSTAKEWIPLFSRGVPRKGREVATSTLAVGINRGKTSA
jgi:hypothetical protein